jgi:hypothetical protein
MVKATLSCLATAGLLLSCGFANARTTISDCPVNQEPTRIDVEAVISTNLQGCPLLEDGELRSLTNQFLSGTDFAYPMPGTCVSGLITEGMFTIGERTEQVRGTTESAMRLFPEANATNPTMQGVFLGGTSQDGIPILSGAAATIVSVYGIDSDFAVQLVLSDRFTINMSEYPLIDTEDFQVLGAKGATASGRLTGRAEIWSPPAAPLVDVVLSVRGRICLGLNGNPGPTHSLPRQPPGRTPR